MTEKKPQMIMTKLREIARPEIAWKQTFFTRLFKKLKESENGWYYVWCAV
jgi:hypothetical protein